MPGSQSNAAPKPLAKRLEAYGCTDIIPLDAKLSLPRQLEYLDLLPTRNNQTPTLAAVAEHQGTALLYLVDACRASNGTTASIAAVCRQLANRSDPAWLGVVQTGSLEIFPIGFHTELDARPIAIIEERNEMAPFFFQSLVHGTFEQNDQLRGTDYVYHKILDLLMQTTNKFVPTEGKGKLDSLEVLSMAGRALFFRFLIDRRIVLNDELHGPDGICPEATDLKDAFSTAERAAQTSAWLDATFNGDFLPLIDESIPVADRVGRKTEYLRFYKRCEHLVGHKLFMHLQAILRGWSAVGGDFQPELDWGDLNFAHIPVGVLSQVYESFSHRADPRTARDTSVHYTPRTIASLMVDEAFAAVKNPAEAKVLDGSCGAGIFLVLAFRRLVRERWLHDAGDERPKTAVIQEILYGKIRGFDISESALRLAALALYITAIELNASPRPPKSLKFPRNLRGEVLYRFGADQADEKKAAFPLGSLGPEVSPDFDKTFDIVIGNPPWTRLRDDKDDDEDTADKGARKSATDELNNEFTAIGRRILAKRGFTDLAKSYKNPDKDPDMPVLWRAMEWAKDGGIIALAMHPRLFMRAKGNGRNAWIAILKSIQITGLLNGSNLRKTAVWQGMNAPFCVFFARNILPEPDQRIQFVTPIHEPETNGRGRFRIDYEGARQVSVHRIVAQPWLLKTLSLGTWLDVEVVESIVARFAQSIGSFWKQFDPNGEKMGKGYSISKESTQYPAPFLGRLLDFVRPAAGFEIDYENLRTFQQTYGRSSAYRPRTIAGYQPPLVVIPKAPGEDPLTPKAFLSSRALAFSQSYYGYSCAGHPDAQTLASLIYLLAHSTLFRYFALMVSVSQGVDYMLFTKQDFDAIPFPDIEKLPAADKAEIRKLASRLGHDTAKPWQELDSFIFHLYGLDDSAAQVATDTLFSAAAYRNASKQAFERTTRETRADFLNTLRDALEPYFDVCGQHAAVREAEFQPDTWREPWFFLSVSRETETIKLGDNIIRKAMEAANQRGCSQIIVHAPKKSALLLGLLNERRWWTVSRARLCAQHIIRERLGACGLPEVP